MAIHLFILYSSLTNVCYGAGARDQNIITSGRVQTRPPGQIRPPCRLRIIATCSTINTTTTTINKYCCTIKNNAVPGINQVGDAKNKYISLGSKQESTALRETRFNLALCDSRRTPKRRAVV